MSSRAYFMDDQIELATVGNGFKRRLIKPMAFCFRRDRLGIQWFTVPKDFTSDFASVPRFLWPVLPPHGRVARSAVLHDWLYCQPEFSRPYADLLFLEAMKADKVPWLQRWAMYLGVRIFGGLFRH